MLLRTQQSRVVAIQLAAFATAAGRKRQSVTVKN